MPSYSGTVSSSQGVRTIDVTPNDVVTFTPSSATYTVEYPIGTVAISASTSTQSLTANNSATQMRILCVSGSVAYANVDNNDGTPFSTTETAALRGLVSPDGILLPDSSPIVFQGDRGIPFVVSGLTLPASGTIGVASITAGVAYVGGMRRAIAGQVLTLTASRDNYVDVNQAGQLVISTTTLGGAAPALAVDSLRLGKVATDATSVTSRQITGSDSLGNWMGNYVSVPYCRHVFSPSTVYTAGDRALAFGSSSTVYDNVNMHSESTQNTRFTVPTAGLYYVMGVIILASGATSSQWNAKIFKNGSSASLGTMSADAAATLTQRAGGLVEAAAGDYFELFLTNSVTVTQAAAAMQVARIA